MLRTVILSNFTVGGGTECTIDQNEVFLVSGYSYASGWNNLGTVTWGQLVAGYNIEITDDTIIEIKITQNIVSTDPPSKTIKVNTCCASDDESVSEDCFCYTFLADVDDPHIYIGLHDGEAYNATIYWGDGTNSAMIGSGNVDHKYNGINEGTYVTIAICGLCPRLTLVRQEKSTMVGDSEVFTGFYDGGMWRAPRLPFGVDNTVLAETSPLSCPPLIVKAINQWGNTEMVSFKAFADQCFTLESIPSGPIPHPTGAINEPDTCFLRTFNGCINLKSMSTCNNLFSKFSDVTKFISTFQDCHQMNELPFDIFSGCTSAYVFKNTFQNCYKMKVSKNVGRTYYEDRIYHNGDANYPSTATTGEDFRFTDTYLKCDGKNAFPIPYWLFYPTGDQHWGCYYKVIWSNYAKTSTSSTAILADYRNGTTTSDSDEWFKNSILV